MTSVVVGVVLASSLATPGLLQGWAGWGKGGSSAAERFAV